MFGKAVVLLSIWCAGVLAVKSNWTKPSAVIECEERAKDEPYFSENKAEEACMRTYFVDRLKTNVMDQNDKTLSEHSTFGKKPPPSGYRVRRDIRVLDVTERHKLFDAFDVLYKNGVMASFGRLHGTDTHRKHHGAAFLPWHRVFIAAFEEKLREVDPDVSLPYWDYSMDYYISLPSESIVWSKCFFGNGNGTVLDGPFQSMYGGFNTPVSRDIAASGCPHKLISKEDIDELMTFCHFADITIGKNLYQQNASSNLEKLHDEVHDWVGGDMGYLGSAAYDPIFYMHHAFIDYIWEQFRLRQSSNECQVDVEEDYRELGDYSVNPNGQQGPKDTMQGFEHLKNSDGLWKNWTTVVYSYEEAPECPNCGNSEYLYCDKSINPNRPNGVCVPVTRDLCVNSTIWAYDRDAPYVKPPNYGAKLVMGPTHFGLHGYGRTRFMSQQEGLVLLKEEIALGFPETPRNVHIYNVTDQSVTVQWTSGFDMGSQQHFIVMRLYNDSTYFALASNIFDNSTTHGINQTWTHVVNGLNENTFYNISVVAENERGFMGFSQPPITFTTHASPKNIDPLHTDSPDCILVVGVGLAIMGLGICAALVYLHIKWRRMRWYCSLNGDESVPLT